MLRRADPRGARDAVLWPPPSGAAPGGATWRRALAAAQAYLHPLLLSLCIALVVRASPHTQTRSGGSSQDHADRERAAVRAPIANNIRNPTSTRKVYGRAARGKDVAQSQTSTRHGPVAAALWCRPWRHVAACFGRGAGTASCLCFFPPHINAPAPPLERRLCMLPLLIAAHPGPSRPPLKASCCAAAARLHFFPRVFTAGGDGCAHAVRPHHGRAPRRALRRRPGKAAAIRQPSAAAGRRRGHGSGAASRARRRLPLHELCVARVRAAAACGVAGGGAFAGAALAPPLPAGARGALPRRRPGAGDAALAELCT